MPTRQSGGTKPAQNQNTPNLSNPECYPYDSPAHLFKWWGGSEHNSCLAVVAEEETEGNDAIINDISGLRLSQMYQVLCRSLKRELKCAKTDEQQEFALITFAARCYRAGRTEGKRHPGGAL